VRPTTRGLVERLGKFRRFASPGLNWIAPVIDRLFRITIAETRIDVRAFVSARHNGRFEEWRGG
jgi:regulator of protease activity HflC (stomatin/prohibitin superfamily)